MTEAAQLLLLDARAALERQLQIFPQTGLAQMFAGWISNADAEAAHITHAVEIAMARSGAQQDFQTVATLGYALDGGFVGASARDTLRQGIERLIGRQAFVDEVPMSFCSDAVGLLGVAVGVRCLDDVALRQRVIVWLETFVQKIYGMEGTENWQRVFFSTADHVLGDKLRLPAKAMADAADARVALRAKSVFAPATETEERDNLDALALIAQSSTDNVPYERAAIRLTALRWISRSNPVAIPGRMTVQSLVKLLERIPAGLRRWTWEKRGRTANVTPVHWDVNDEYHVQNLVWALLAPLLPDLDDEQYLKKIALKNPRADLFIPSMRTIIELKFVRPADRWQKIIDEISSDASLYGAMGNECQGIIPVIWDDSARTHEHDYLKQGLKKLPGVIDVIIVSRPSDWKRETPDDEA